MPFARLSLAAALLAFASVSQAQDLMLFSPETFGQVISPRSETLLDEVQLEAQVGDYNNEFIYNYGLDSLFARKGRAVGKLSILTNVGHAPCTAFLIEGNRLITNHHCVPGILDNPRMKEQGATSISAMQVYMGFVRDGIDKGVKTFFVNPVPLETNKELDYTVLQVLGDANAEFGALELSAALPSDLDPFWVIGHPMGEAQRISREKCQADSPAIAKHRLRHTCDTLPGNSGSPVIDAGSQKVIALHHAGSRAGQVNYAVPMADILAQSRVLTAAMAPVTRPDDQLSALLAELERLRKEQDADKARAEAEAQRRAEEAARKAEAERQKLADELAALKAERDRLAAEAMTPRDAGAEDTEKTRLYWESVKTFWETGWDDVLDLNISPEGNSLSIAYADGAFRVVPVLHVAGRYWEDTIFKKLPTEEAMRHAEFSRDGARVLFLSKEGVVRVRAVPDGREITRIEVPGAKILHAALSPEGTRVATESNDGRIRIHDLSGATPVVLVEGFKTLDDTRMDFLGNPLRSPVSDIFFLPGGERIALDGPFIGLIDARTGTVLQELGGKQGFAVSADGRRVFALSDSEKTTAHVWDLDSGRVISTLRGDAELKRVERAALSPDGRLLATSNLGLLNLWDAETGALLGELKGHAGWILAMDFSPDGGLLATGADDGTAQIWDTSSGRRLAVLLNGYDVMRAEFTPDGQNLVTVSQVGLFTLWGRD